MVSDDIHAIVICGPRSPVIRGRVPVVVNVYTQPALGLVLGGISQRQRLSSPLSWQASLAFPHLPQEFATMNYHERISIISNAIQGRNAKFGKAARADETGVGKPGRWISDDPSWRALYVPHQLSAKLANSGDAGPDWDLLQLWVHGSLRMTAHLRGHEISEKLYISGPWESTFHLHGLPTLPPLLPGGYVSA